MHTKLPFNSVFLFFQPFHTSFHTLPRRQAHGGSLQPLSVTTFLVPSSSSSKQDPALSDPGGVQTLGRRKRLSSSRLTETSDHIYAMVQPKDKRMSTTSSASLGSSLHQPSMVCFDKIFSHFTPFPNG